jgi:hypothetical protein
MTSSIHRLIPLLPLLTLLLICGCAPAAKSLTETQIDTAIAAAPSQITYHDEARKVEATGFEATKWITTSGNFAPFASNHFKTRADALAFVRNLYRFGATGVYAADIMDEPDRIKHEGGPYADALWLVLPKDPIQRRALFKIEADAAKAEGFGPYEDTCQDKIFFWWD